MNKAIFFASILLLTAQLKAEPVSVFVSGSATVFEEPFNYDTHPIRDFNGQFGSIAQGYIGSYFSYPIRGEFTDMTHQGGNRFVPNRLLRDFGVQDRQDWGIDAAFNRILPFQIGGRQEGITYRIYFKQSFEFKIPDVAGRLNTQESLISLRLMCQPSETLSRANPIRLAWNGAGLWNRDETLEGSAVVQSSTCPSNKFYINFYANGISEIVVKNLELLILE